VTRRRIGDKRGVDKAHDGQAPFNPLQRRVARLVIGGSAHDAILRNKATRRRMRPEESYCDPWHGQKNPSKFPSWAIGMQPRWVQMPITTSQLSWPALTL